MNKALILALPLLAFSLPSTAFEVHTQTQQAQTIQVAIGVNNIRRAVKAGQANAEANQEENAAIEAAQAQDKDVSDTAKRQLEALHSNSAQALQRVAKEVYRAGHGEKVVTDTMAEILIQRSKVKNPAFGQALAWTAKTLGNLGNDRYRDALTLVKKKGKDKHAVKYSKAALKQLPKTKNEQYVPGTIQLNFD